MGGALSRTAKFDPARDLPDLSGKVIIVTAGNAGIGLATVQHLARKGAKVYIASRSETKARDAIARLQADGLAPGNGEVAWLRLDLGDPANAKAAARDFMGQEQRLDVLVHNAALVMSSSSVGPLGIQETMNVNHFGPFAFTHTLLPLLTQTCQLPGADVRVVNVTSNAYRTVSGQVRFRNKDDFNAEDRKTYVEAMKRYSISKLAGVLSINELQRRFDAQSVPIICLSVHPGGVHKVDLLPPTDTEDRTDRESGSVLSPPTSPSAAALAVPPPVPASAPGTPRVVAVPLSGPSETGEPGPSAKQEPAAPVASATDPPTNSSAAGTGAPAAAATQASPPPAAAPARTGHAPTPRPGKRRRLATWASHKVLASPTEGAYTTVFAAASPAVRTHAALFRGAFLVPVGKIARQTRLARDGALARELWETTEAILKEGGVV